MQIGFGGRYRTVLLSLLTFTFLTRILEYVEDESNTGEVRNL